MSRQRAALLVGVVVVVALAITACSSTPAAPPTADSTAVASSDDEWPSDSPVVTLITDRGETRAYELSFCWGEICEHIESLPYDAADFVPVPRSEPLRVRIEGPRPNEVGLSLHQDMYGPVVAEATIVAVPEVIEWEPNAAPGRYAIFVGAVWDGEDELLALVPIEVDG